MKIHLKKTNIVDLRRRGIINGILCWQNWTNWLMQFWTWLDHLNLHKPWLCNHVINILSLVQICVVIGIWNDIALKQFNDLTWIIINLNMENRLFFRHYSTWTLSSYLTIELLDELWYWSSYRIGGILLYVSVIVIT